MVLVEVPIMTDPQKIIDSHRRQIEAYRIGETQARRKLLHLFRVATWFAENEPGTPVPEWCTLAMANGAPDITEDELNMSEAECSGE